MEHKPAPAWAKAYLTFALVLAFAPAAALLIGAVGTKLGLWSWKFGFGAMMVNGPVPGLGWAPALAMAAIAVSLIAVIVTLSAGLWRRALAALLIGLLTMGAFIFVGGQARKAPPIHDVATDWSEPLTFSDAVITARGAGANLVEADPRAPDKAPGIGGQRIADINAETCPDAKPVLSPKPAADAYADAKAALTAQGLEIVTDDPGSGRLEAVATSFWYGFKDDVVVRVQPDGSGTRIDVRSISRVGMSDLGQNCKRIATLSSAMKR